MVGDTAKRALKLRSRRRLQVSKFFFEPSPQRREIAIEFLSCLIGLDTVAQLVAAPSQRMIM